jgi:hypothetical protein
MDLYPDDGTLPGLAKHIVYDHDSDVDAVFAEETAGFPAQSFTMPSNPTTSEPDVLLESMGVSDPECTKISGRAITASALCNLMPVSPEEPDLVLHRSAEPVTDYHNPNLLPGMFPTLYPFGIGGFDANTRPTPLAFANQAQYCFNLHDKVFWYHRSFMFVVLNIHQRHTAHLRSCKDIDNSIAIDTPTLS